MNSPASSALNGKCECGTVQYRVADEFLYAANCHCSRCRAATGSAFKAFAGIERDSIRPTHHIFVGSKAPWFELTDDLPQFEGHAR